MRTESGYEEYCMEFGCKSLAAREYDGKFLCEMHYLESIREEGMLLDQD